MEVIHELCKFNFFAFFSQKIKTFQVKPNIRWRVNVRSMPCWQPPSTWSPAGQAGKPGREGLLSLNKAYKHHRSTSCSWRKLLLLEGQNSDKLTADTQNFNSISNVTISLHLGKRKSTNVKQHKKGLNNCQ
jgi:hypothetical protein